MQRLEIEDARQPSDGEKVEVEQRLGVFVGCEQIAEGDAAQPCLRGPRGVAEHIGKVVQNAEPCLLRGLVACEQSRSGPQVQ